MNKIEANHLQKTEVVTFRLPASTLLFLRNKANQERLSVNALLNRIIQDHMEFELIESSTIPIQRNLLSSMLNHLDTADIKQLSGVSKKHCIDLLYIKNGSSPDLETFLETLLVWVKHSGFTFKEWSEDGKRILAIRHDMGESWSKFTKLSLEAVFSQLTKEKVIIKELENMLLITIEVRNQTAEASY